MSYEAVDIGLIEPRKRDYTKGKAQAKTVKGGAPQVPQPGSELKPDIGREETWRKEGEKVAEGESIKED